MPPKSYLHRVFVETDAMPIQSTSTAVSSGPAITVPLGTSLSAAARELILSTLEHCGGERKRTAEMLGICTKTLYNRLREYGIREDHRAGPGAASRAPSAPPADAFQSQPTS